MGLTDAIKLNQIRMYVGTNALNAAYLMWHTEEIDWENDIHVTLGPPSVVQGHLKSSGQLPVMHYDVKLSCAKIPNEWKSTTMQSFN